MRFRDVARLRHGAYTRRMSKLYGDGARQLQDRFDTRRLADRIEERLVRAEIPDDDRAFIERMDMFFLATVDARGHASCSYKGGEPGFVRVLDPRTLAFPSNDGNGMFLSLGAVLETGEVGLLFIDFDGQSRVRSGSCSSTSTASRACASTAPRRSTPTIRSCRRGPR